MIKQRLGLFEPISVFCYICKSIFISHNVQVFGKSSASLMREVASAFMPKTEGVRFDETLSPSVSFADSSPKGGAEIFLV